MSAPALGGPIAYLTGEYPRATDTFIWREITEHRRAGIEVLSCSIRRTSKAHLVGEEQRAEQDRVFHVLETALNPVRLLHAHLTLIASAPLRWWKTARLAAHTAPPGFRAVIWQIFYFLEAGVLAHYMRDRGVVHLHNHFAGSSCTVAMLASQMSGIPFSFTEHGPDTFFDALRWRLDQKISRAERVIAISHFCRSQLMLFSDPIYWPKISIVHCGVHPAQYGIVPRESYGQRVLFVGRLDAVKGGPLLLEAFAKALTTHPGATLDIVGDGSDRNQLETQAVTLGLDEAVTFHGYLAQSEVARRMDSADILVLPSFAEGVPVVLMEAMASRLPVIASHIAGVPELVENGISGFLVPPGDVTRLTNRLSLLLSDADLCQRMGEAGRAKVEAEFDVAHESAWLAKIFAGEKGPRPQNTGNASSQELVHKACYEDQAAEEQRV